MPCSGTCFDLYGVDLIILQDGKAILLETNNGPEIYSKNPQVTRVNDRVHKQLLRDAVPLMARPRTPTSASLDRFDKLLLSFTNTRHVRVCESSLEATRRGPDCIFEQGTWISRCFCFRFKPSMGL